MLAWLGCIGINEIASPVFFRRKIGIPGRQAAATVVKRAAGFGPGRAVASNHFGRAHGWAANIHWRCAGNTTIEDTAFSDLPFSINLADMHDAHAVSGHFFTDFISRALAADAGGAVGVEYIGINVFMVH